jgi:hypothetical protein
MNVTSGYNPSGHVALTVKTFSPKFTWYTEKLKHNSYKYMSKLEQNRCEVCGNCILCERFSK